MNNNNLDQISMRSSKRKRSRFNLKSVNETSFGIGEIQPLMVKEVNPDSNSVISLNNIVRLAPMVAPTFGQLKLHHNMMFVGMSDLTDKFAALLANEPVAFGGGVTRTPQELPHISKGVLSSFILSGSKATLYRLPNNNTDNTDSVDGLRWHYMLSSGWSATDPIYEIIAPYNGVTDFDNTMQDFFGISSMTDVYTLNKLWCADLAATDGAIGHAYTAFRGYNGAGINVGRVLGWNHDLWLPSSNFSPWSFLCDDATLSGVTGGSAQALRSTRYFNGVSMDLEDVSPDNADYSIIWGEGNHRFYLCFRLSDFGKRLRKLLIAAGYGIDFNSTTQVSLMPLFALYKAWFDSFGITLYQGWETTNCAKCLQNYDSDYLVDYDVLMTYADTTPPSALTVLQRQQFVAFMADLADMWFTEEQDFVSAHIRSAAVSPNDKVPSAMGDSPNVNYRINITDTNISSGEDASVFAGARHAYIDQVLHSQLDSEILKRLYKVTNRNTIAGRRIAELLKAQGLGDYMKRCKSRFIGHWACDINIFDVTATADSFNTADGSSSVLGEYVGKGIGDDSSKKFKHSTGEYGFIIDLAAVVPETGWTNGEALSVRDYRKLDFYNPEYDGLGFEISPKSIITSDVTCAARVSPGTTESMDGSFGFVPRYTKHKVARNVMNGDFSLRSTRSSFLPFSLDKYVAVGDRISKQITIGSTTNAADTFTIYKLLTPGRTPIASPMYRYLARFPWMGNLQRIFANIGRDKLANDPYAYMDYAAADGESVNAWYLLKTDDNFIVQTVFLYDYYAPMLPIEESFETHEDGNNGPSDMSIGKA